MQRVRMGAALAAISLASLSACGGQRPAADQSPTADRSLVATVTPSTSATPTPTPVPVPTPIVPSDLPTAAPDRVVEGGDVSWPNCPEGMGIPQKQGKGLPMPLDSAEYVVLGLTNGPGFTPNPCLGSQVAWVKERKLMASAYSVVSQPDTATIERYGSAGPFPKGERAGRLANVGYQQAAFNLRTMKAAGLTTPIVWVDVEPVPLFDWGSDKAANAAVVQGAVRGYKEAGYAVGVYSTQYLWQEVVGDLRLGLPEWRAAGMTSREEALRRCGDDRRFQGGLAVLSQWVDGQRDRNVTCPGTAVRLGVWFHQY